MKFEELSIAGSWIANTEIHRDDRGTFTEFFKPSELKEMFGYSFVAAQGNVSISNAGVLRGIHFSSAPQGQAKWVRCVNGSIFDVVIDIRPDSMTFGKWLGIELSAQNSTSIIIGPGLGHAFMALENDSIVQYLTTSEYSSKSEHEINPFDPEIGIDWPYKVSQISKKDELAPGLVALRDSGKLPNLSDFPLY